MNDNHVLYGWFKEMYQKGNHYSYLDIVIRDGQLHLINDEQTIKKMRVHMINFTMRPMEVPKRLHSLKLNGLNIFYEMSLLQSDSLLIPYDLYNNDIIIRIGIKNGIEGFVKNGVIFKDGKLVSYNVTEEEVVSYLSTGIASFIEDLSELKNTLKRGV